MAVGSLRRMFKEMHAGTVFEIDECGYHTGAGYKRATRYWAYPVGEARKQVAKDKWGEMLERAKAGT